MLNQNVLEQISQVIENQFIANANKNIFCNINQLFFPKDTLMTLSKLRKYICLLSREQINYMAYKYQDQFLEEFYKVNQYTYFNEDAQRYIRTIYLSLLSELKDTNLTLRKIEVLHYDRISKFIKTSNPSIYRINHNDNKMAYQFVCEQYSGVFLCDLLNISKLTVKEPILDIGCGGYGNLVTYLRSMNIRAVGIDRETSARGCSSIDWLLFDYGSEKWNTIISNLSFTSHFLYHHLQDEEITTEYATTYMKILTSLKKNGQWIYTPSIPFFEELLPDYLYQVERKCIHKEFSKTVITRL